ncbi:MAG TPA: RES family NAD+ phosphorylase [Acidisarcina sp.]
MVLWRVSKFATLDGAGGLLVSGRWHTAGRPVIYCTSTPAAALLETLVHVELDPDEQPISFQLLKIECPFGQTIERTSLLYSGDVAACQAFGDDWLRERRTLLLEVPSALVPETWNVLANPLHPEAGVLKITAAFQHAFDSRFFSR